MTFDSLILSVTTALVLQFCMTIHSLISENLKLFVFKPHGVYRSGQKRLPPQARFQHSQV